MASEFGRRLKNIFCRHVKINCHTPMKDLVLEGQAKQKMAANLLVYKHMGDVHKKFLLWLKAT